jgi:hypothetical protein
LCISIAAESVSKIQIDQYESIKKVHENEISALKKQLEEEKNRPAKEAHHHLPQ